MFTLIIVLLSLLYIASLIGVSVALDDSPKKEDGNFQVTTRGGCFSMFTLFLSFVPLIIIARSWGVVTLWSWFVTPVFNISSPTQIQAYGLILLTMLFSPPSNTKNHKTKGEYLYTYISPFASIGMTVLIGWVLQKFV